MEVHALRVCQASIRMSTAVWLASRAREVATRWKQAAYPRAKTNVPHIRILGWEATSSPIARAI